MFKNYLKIALRQLRKQKMYSAIKIGGFAFSISACLLIALFISDELSYDKSYPDAARTYRIVELWREDGKLEKGAHMQPPMAAALKADFPEVEIAGRLMSNSLFWGAGSNHLRRADKEENTYEQGFSYADQKMLDMLQPHMIYGDNKHALDEPLTMVISKEKADKYFPGQNPLGKVMYLNDNKERAYKISGVMQDFPHNSHLQFDFLLTLSGIEFWEGEQLTWRSSNYYTYIKLKEGTNIAAFEKKLSDGILKKYILPGRDEKQAAEIAQQGSYSIQAVPDIHLKSYDIHDDLLHGDIRFIWLFGAVAVFILIIACINFVNLSTAKSANRAKEVGLRKVVGSYRSSLIKQFLTESLLFSFFSFVLGIAIAALLLPYFNTLASKSLSIPWNIWWVIPSIILAAVIVGIVSGLYPAFYLSSFNPINVLKGQVSRGTKNSVLRNGLVVFQFTISIILIISTFVVYNQMQFILNKKVGFEKDQVLLIEGANTLDKNVINFKNELKKLSSVKSVSVSDYLPVSGTKRNGNTFYNEGKTKEESGVGAQYWKVDNDYIKTMGMKIVEGRDFSRDIASDSESVIINQTLANKLNLKDPIGKRITNGNVFTVIGVVQDFNFESLRDDINGICLKRAYSPSIVSVKVNTADMKILLSSVTATWKKFSPAQPIRYSFLDERFASMYADVQRMGKIFTSFAVIAIIIACLGLFALSSFMAEQRGKEIGVRKVLGASVTSITTLLSKDFIKLVIIAIVIASPVAWWAMNKWLQDFTYRITITWWIFALAAVVAIMIAILTVSFQSIKAALMNPVKSLRSE